MRVLHVSHTASVAGAEHSLLVLMRALSDQVSCTLACPEGELASAARLAGVAVEPIPGTDLSSRLHPRHTTTELLRAARTSRALRRIARRIGADVVHANTPRAGLISSFAAGAGGTGPVVHVRDSTPPGRVPGVTLSFLARRASAFVSTSRFLAAELPDGAVAAIVANAVDPMRFGPAALSRASARARLGIDPDDPVLTTVAQISPHKGQSEAIRALALVRRDHPRARLLVVGSIKFTSAATRYDNHAYHSELQALAAEAGLRDAVAFLGERPDIPQILAASDIVLVPSWYEPFGRAAVEGMMMGLPVIATSVGGVTEVITDGVDGLIRPPRDPSGWSAAIGELLADPDRRRTMGEAGRRRALQEFTPERHAEQMLALFEQVAGAGGTRRRGARPADAGAFDRYLLAPTGSEGLDHG